MTPYLLPVYFCTGLVRDALGCLYYLAVSKEKAKKAGLLAGGIELFDLLVIVSIAKMGWPLELGVAYAFGTALGTYMVIKYKGRK